LRLDADERFNLCAHVSYCGHVETDGTRDNGRYADAEDAGYRPSLVIHSVSLARSIVADVSGGAVGTDRLREI